jgi:hypothetical protein
LFALRCTFAVNFLLFVLSLDGKQMVVGSVQFPPWCLWVSVLLTESKFFELISEPSLANYDCQQDRQLAKK